jgi:YidC/Oxa1 family membrane protein insertase
MVRRGDKQDVEQIELPKEAFQITSLSPDWVSTSNGFFGIIMDPTTGIDSGIRVEKISGIQAPSRLTQIDTDVSRYKAQDLPAYEVFLPIQNNSPAFEVRVFAGPFSENVLKTVDHYYAQKDGVKDSDYIACQTFHGWFAFISEPFAKFLFFMMKLFHHLFGSWVVCIVLVTVVLRVLLYPLNSWSMRSMKSMQIVAPKIKAIQEKYKKEPQKAQMEILNLYREHKVNPLSGCLPLLLQMPFLIGMFDLLKSAFELRGAPFIHGWIDDLASPDVLFSWKYSIPLIGTEFHLLPIFLGGIMFLQQRMSSQTPKDPSQMTDQQRQQRSMGTIMTVVMTVMFYQFPSGLNIYWISSMALSIGQQWWTNYNMDKGLKNNLTTQPSKNVIPFPKR